MASLFRWLSLTAVIATAAFTLERSVIEPYRCNLRLKNATKKVQLMETLDAKDMRLSKLGRQVVQTLQPCVVACPDDVAASMVLAAAYRFLGRGRDAIFVYQTALRYDRRPELYFNLGETQLEEGQTELGVQNLITACIYDPAFLDGIGEHQPEVLHALALYQLRLTEIANEQRR